VFLKAIRGVISHKFKRQIVISNANNVIVTWLLSKQQVSRELASQRFCGILYFGGSTIIAEI